MARPTVWAAALATTNATRNNIPYVPTRHDTVRDLLWLADVGTNDVVYDLGSGDGRIVIAAARDFHARKAVGVETDSNLVRESRENAAGAGVADRVEFIQGSLFVTDCSAATVAVLYLGHDPNLELRASLVAALKPGTRVVSHQFGMGEWTPDKTLDVRTTLLGMYSEKHNPFATNTDTPDFRTPFIRRNHDMVSSWIVPAPVAGTWRGKLQMNSGEAELTLTLHQRISGVSGTFQLQGATNLAGNVQTDIWGTNLRLHCVPTNSWSYGTFLMWFDGHATNDTIAGKLFISTKEGTQETPWTGRRDKVDFTGVWMWPGAMDSTVELKIERRNGRLTATYEDPVRDVSSYVKKGPIHVTDFYDFGGGFYFTLLLGREENGSRRMGPDDGWLIGEAVANENALNGTIAFYPYPRDLFSEFPRSNTSAPPPAEIKKTPRQGRRDWQPKRVR